MPLNYIQKNYLKYNNGKGFICGHVEALHAMPPAADLYTDKIVEKLVKKTGCAGIISTISRKNADLNRMPNGSNDEAIKEYRNTVKEIINFLGILDPTSKEIVKPYLHLSFHGMKDTHYGPFAIEIGTLMGRTCSSEMRTWFKNSLETNAKKHLPNLVVVFDKKFIGDESISFHRLGDGQYYQGYKQHFHTFQIEISRTLRGKYCRELVYLFAEIIMDFQKEFILE